MIVACGPKPGQDAELLALARSHVPILRRLVLATDRPVTAMRARDGVIVEILERAPGAIVIAHRHPEVLALRKRYEAALRLRDGERAARSRQPVPAARSVIRTCLSHDGRLRYAA